MVADLRTIMDISRIKSMLYNSRSRRSLLPTSVAAYHRITELESDI